MLFSESTAEEYGWQQTGYITHLKFTIIKTYVTYKSYLHMSLTLKNTANKSH